jgi:hypothetical protein
MSKLRRRHVFAAGTISIESGNCQTITQLLYSGGPEI